MPNSTPKRSADALQMRDYARSHGTLTDEKCRELFRRSQADRAQRVRLEIARLARLAEEILREGGD